MTTGVSRQRNWLTSLTLLLFSGAAYPFDLPQLAATLGAVAQAQVEYREERQIALLDERLISFGELHYTAPDRLEKRMLMPYQERAIIAGAQVQIWQGDELTREFTITPGSPLFIASEALRATLAGDLVALQRWYQVELQGDADAWTLRLTPHKQSQPQIVARMLILGSNHQLQRIDTTETGGDRSTLFLAPAAKK
jgi:hypothetical protein